MLEVLANLTDAPCDAAGVRVDQVAVLVWPNEITWAPASGGDDWLAGGPRLQDDDAERLVAAGHHHCVTRLEERFEMRGPALHGACKVHSVTDSSLASLGLQMSLHVAIAYEDELRIASGLQDSGDSVEKQVWTLLDSQTPNEEEHGCHDIKALVSLCVPCPIVLPLHVHNGLGMNSVVDYLDLPAINVVVGAHLVLEHA
mmetsp:Transcript_56070/g.146179  ORF Transcript_56070/g.146179 Transcript_56070/m.146179 type:complete len:200 (-) Transcript_56070:61-660(-)